MKKSFWALFRSLGMFNIFNSLGCKTLPLGKAPHPSELNIRFLPFSFRPFSLAPWWGPVGAGHKSVPDDGGCTQRRLRRYALRNNDAKSDALREAQRREEGRCRALRCDDSLSLLLAAAPLGPTMKLISPAKPCTCARRSFYYSPGLSGPARQRGPARPAQLTVSLSEEPADVTRSLGGGFAGLCHGA